MFDTIYAFDLRVEFELRLLELAQCATHLERFVRVAFMCGFFKLSRGRRSYVLNSDDVFETVTYFTIKRCPALTVVSAVFVALGRMPTMAPHCFGERCQLPPTGFAASLCCTTLTLLRPNILSVFRKCDHVTKSWAGFLAYSVRFGGFPGVLGSYRFVYGLPGSYRWLSWCTRFVSAFFLVYLVRFGAFRGVLGSCRRFSWCTRFVSAHRLCW